jgi:DMSO/TMAO reductase YedYZ molybdopterin-dependent catalytic subunit
MSRRDPKTPEQELAARTRRSFLTMGVAAAAGYGGWRWLRSRPEVGGTPWPLRRALQMNENIARAYYSEGHLVPVFPASSVQEPRPNGDIGLGGDFDPDQWRLSVKDSEGQTRFLTLDMIRELPKVEQITQLNCIEGWTNIVHWAGARFSDFTAQYAPASARARYVSMQTPDEEYFVGLDMASAMHPQTLLCYELNGKPLTAEHGAPLRLVIPVKYGIKSIKRIGSIAYTDERPRDYWAEEGYDWYAGL